MKKNILFILILFFAGGTAKAQSGRNDVLDFESDVIEGQKKTPDLFLQVEMETADLSAVLYDRKNFNDYHVVDSKRRPLLSNPRP